MKRIINFGLCIITAVTACAVSVSAYAAPSTFGDENGYLSDLYYANFQKDIYKYDFRGTENYSAENKAWSEHCYHSYYADRKGIYFRLNVPFEAPKNAAVDGKTASLSFADSGKTLIVTPSNMLDTDTVHSVVMDGNETAAFELKSLMYDDFSDGTGNWGFDSSVNPSSYSAAVSDNNGQMILSTTAQSNYSCRVFNGSVWEEAEKWRDYTVDFDIANTSSDFRMFVDMHSNTVKTTDVSADSCTFMIRSFSSGWYLGILNSPKRYNFNVWEMASNENSLGKYIYTNENPSAQDCYGNITASVYGDNQYLNINGRQIVSSRLTTGTKGAFTLDIAGSPNPLVIDSVRAYTFVNYADSGSFKSEAIIIKSAVCSDNAVEINMEFSSAADKITGKLIAAVYSDSGELIGVSEKVKAAKTDSISVSVDADKLSSAVSVKVMCWDEFENMQPRLGYAVSNVEK